MKRAQPERALQKAATFKIEMPPSANRLWRVAKGRAPYKSEEYATWRGANAWAIAHESWKVPGDKPVSEPVAVTIRARRPHALRDLDNCIKPICDVLQEGGAIENDRLIHSIDAAWADVGDEFVHIEVIPLRAKVAA